MAVEGQFLYGTAGADGYLNSLNPETGTLKWSHWLKEGCAHFGLRPESVLVGDYEKTIQELCLSDGAVLQELQTDGEVVGRMVVDGDFAYTILWGDENRAIQLVKIRI